MLKVTWFMQTRRGPYESGNEKRYLQELDSVEGWKKLFTGNRTNRITGLSSTVQRFVLALVVKVIFFGAGSALS